MKGTPFFLKMWMWSDGINTTKQLPNGVLALYMVSIVAWYWCLWVQYYKLIENKWKLKKEREEEKGKRGEDCHSTTVPWTHQPGTDALSTLLDMVAHIVGSGCLQGSLSCRILPETEKSHNIKQVNPWIPVRYWTIRGEMILTFCLFRLGQPDTRLDYSRFLEMRTR